MTHVLRYLRWIASLLAGLCRWSPVAGPSDLERLEAWASAEQGRTVEILRTGDLVPYWSCWLKDARGRVVSGTSVSGRTDLGFAVREALLKWDALHSTKTEGVKP